ncbi:MAG: extracellular solute-binding protein, partial [Candidatus Omnitrophica bacterium]|nr:extracellular solute-binding protein [Candidatus Omnitrophota bacterium]
MMLFRICIIILITLCVGGCARSERSDLNVVMSLTEEEWSVFRRKIFPVFEKRHNIKIRSYQIASGRLSAKLEALTHAGRSEIDLFAQDNMSLASLVNRNLVSDLTPYEKDIPGSVYPNLIDAIKFEDKLYFMPFRPNVQITYYNRSKFDEYGLKVPETWDELMAAGRTFVEKEGTGRILVKGYGGNPTATQVYEFILQAGGDPYTFNGPGCIKAFRFLQDLAPYMSPETGRAKWDTVNDSLARREVYIAQNWPFAVPVLIKDYELDMIGTYSGWAGPAGERHVIGGDVLGIPRNARF